MKQIILFIIFCWIFSSCSVFQKQKYGCPTNGKNVGAEKIASGDKASIKAARKAGKFKH